MSARDAVSSLAVRRFLFVIAALGFTETKGATGSTGFTPHADQYECLSRPQPWECGSPGTYCGDKGPCADAGSCVAWRCVWPTDGGP